MTSDVNKVASVVGGKTARACDSCIRKRARWYCAADDAFLCQSCDSSVHSANPLARRHERVRLKYASFKSPDDGLMETRSNRVPSWNKRKARTPRGNKQQSSSSITSPITSDEVVINSLYHVPEALSDETTSFDEQLVYGRVPIFDSFAGELCTCPHSADEGNEMSIGNQNASFGENDMKGYFCNDLGFLTSDMDLEEFAAADVLGIDGLGLMGCDMMVEGSMSGGRSSVKEEDEEVLIEMAAEQFLQYDNEEAAAEIILNDCDVKKRKILLRLDYDGILSAWPDGSSPWTSRHPTRC
ncbi:unnamed protein product [Rhodiola kirilowii]